ncbi:ABC-type amino acid transport substrate-binding protein [Streptomyces sp. V4I8]
MKLRKVSAAAAAAIVLSITATACGGDGDSDSNSGSGGGDKIKIGIKYDQPGLGQKEPDGTFSGFDVDVATYVAKELGYEPNQIEWVETKSADRENALARGDVKFIAATYSITDERKEKVDFAGPYLLAHQDLLVKSDSDITEATDLNDKNLCSVVGSTSAQNVKNDFAPKANLKQNGGYSECIAALQSGAVDALTTDDSILAGLRRAGAVQGPVQARRPEAEQRELRHRCEEGRHRDRQQDQRRPREDGQGQGLGQGGRRQLRSGQLQERARAEDRRHRQVAQRFTGAPPSTAIRAAARRAIHVRHPPGSAGDRVRLSF